MTGSNIWDQVLARIETKVNRHSFYTWFKPTAFVSDRDGSIRIRVPNALFRDCLSRYEGREENNLGDGFFATFEVPSNAISCPSITVSRARSCRRWSGGGE